MIRTLLSVLTNVVVLGTLGGIAWWGHHTDWTFVQVPEKAAAKASAQAIHPSRVAGAVTIAGQETSRLIGIETATVSERRLTAELSVHGQVTYVQSRVAQLSARVPGIVWSVSKQAGDLVEEGEVLAILDSADVGKAKADFLQALVQTELRAKNLARIEEAPESVPERVRREADAALREAKVQRYNAQQTLINLGLSVRIDALKDLSDTDRASRLRFLGLPESFTRDHDPETTTANLIPLKAPFDGVVIRREITPGEVVNPEKPQLTIADVRTMWLELDVHKEDSIHVRVGQVVTFEADGLPHPLTTTVSRISTEADSRTRTVHVMAEVDNPPIDDRTHSEGSTRCRKRLLEANVFGTARIRVRESPTAVMVPQSAVVWSGKANVVFVPVVGDGNTKSNAEFLGRPVVTGVTSEDGFVEIVSGLAVGEEVVVAGAHVLHSERQIREMSSGTDVASSSGTP